MRRSRKSSAIRSIVVGLAASAVVWGCASSGVLRVAEAQRPAVILPRFLDRWEKWRSMGARIKLTVSLGDSTFSARGHLLYLIGERYEVGFVKPYDRYLGNFYVVPDQIIYWDTYGKPKRFGIEDTVLLSELLPLGLPDWDPRDLLPFPVSGRSTGFQPDSIWSDKSGQHVTGMGGDVRHDLALSSTRLLLTEETVRRPGREPVVKRYKRFRTLNGWPVPTKVTCADRSGITVLTWTLSDVRLDAEPFSPVPVESGEANTGARP